MILKKFKSNFESCLCYLTPLLIIEVLMFALIYFLREFTHDWTRLTQILAYLLVLLLNFNIPLIIVKIRNRYTRKSITNDKAQIVRINPDKIEPWLAKKIFYLLMLLISIILGLETFLLLMFPVIKPLLEPINYILVYLLVLFIAIDSLNISLYGLTKKYYAMIIIVVGIIVFYLLGNNTISKFIFITVLNASVNWLVSSEGFLYFQERRGYPYGIVNSNILLKERLARIKANVLFFTISYSLVIIIKEYDIFNKIVNSLSTVFINIVNFLFLSTNNKITTSNSDVINYTISSSIVLLLTLLFFYLAKKLVNFLVSDIAVSFGIPIFGFIAEEYNKELDKEYYENRNFYNSEKVVIDYYRKKWECLVKSKEQKLCVFLDKKRLIPYVILSNSFDGLNEDYQQSIRYREIQNEDSKLLFKKLAKISKSMK